MTRIAAGYEHTCVLRISAGVACWGANSTGQLGDGTTTDRSFPVDVSNLGSGVRAIAAGGFHGCALTVSGGVLCWGSNEYGQLGNGANTDSSVPVDVVGLASGVAAISVGWSSTCVVTTDGEVKCWGHNFYGWLGDGTTTDSNVPVGVPGLDAAAVTVGTLHTCALTTAGGVKCWGYGQAADPRVIQTTVPVDVPGLSSGVVTVSAGLDRTCALLTGGGMTCWGPYYRYSTDVETAPDGVVSIELAGLAGDVASLSIGEAHGCALTDSGSVACWGYDGHGQLGRGIASGEMLPVLVQVAGLEGEFAGIAVGGLHTCALAADGGVSCWGSNMRGQLGSILSCSSTSVPVPASVDGATAPPPGIEPYEVPVGRIEHQTGPMDVVLRYDIGPDFGVSDLAGEQFQPGPGFTLYGDGTVIFRDERAELPPADGPIVRARPFTVAHLDKDQVQSILRFALGEGGLAGACDRYDRYETQDTDIAEFHILTVHVDGLHKRVDAGASALGPLMNELRAFKPGSDTPTSVWAPDRYWGNLLPADAWIEEGLLPARAEVGSVPWPWPGISPEDFAGLDPGEGRQPGRRVMSADEAAVLGLWDNGGVVQRIFLIGPDRKTTYSFSLWPMLPDETGS